MGSEYTNVRNYEAVLVLAFTKSSVRKGMFSTRMFHTDVEILLINSPPPVIPTVGMEGIDQHFDSWKLLGINIDRIKGVHSYTTHAMKIASSTHNVLCIPLTSDENKSVIEFIHEIRGLPYNHWDSLYSRTASLIPSGLMDDVVIDECSNVAKSIRRLHPAQLVVLIFRQCLDPKSMVAVKLWGFNSRLTTANEIFEQLRVTCIAIDADSLNRNILQALNEGTPNTTRSYIP
jgi:hypothetical protein